MPAYLSEELERIVSDAYRTFRTKAPANMGICAAGCCMPANMEQDMLRRPSRDLTLTHMQEWFSAAAQDPMPMDVCRFLLPRVFDGLARQEDMATVGIEISLRRFAPLIEDNAVCDAFQQAYFAAIVASPHEMLDDILCMFVLGGWSADDLAGQFLTMPPTVIVDRLWRDWCSWTQSPYVMKTAFWPKGEGAEGLYGSQKLRELVEGVILSDATPMDLAVKADAVLDILLMMPPPS